MANTQVNFQATITGVDTTSAQSVFTRIISGFQLAATSWQASDWLQVPTTGISVTLPAATVYFVFVRNLGANNISVSFSPVGGGTPTSIVLLPVGSNVGGIFVYALSAESGGGITALEFAAASATTPVEYFVAA